MTTISAIFFKNIDMTIDIDAHRKVVLINTFEIEHLDNSTHNANIYCIDEKENVIWRVDSDKGIMEQDAFVYIEKKENGIYARRFFGTIYLIEVETGKSRAIGWSK